MQLRAWTTQLLRERNSLNWDMMWRWLVFTFARIHLSNRKAGAKVFVMGLQVHGSVGSKVVSAAIAGGQIGLLIYLFS